MKEPKFSDAPCFGKEFDAASKVCGVCLANKACRRKSQGKHAAAEPSVLAQRSPARLLKNRLLAVVAQPRTPGL